jgi:hypothetical protein
MNSQKLNKIEDSESAVDALFTLHPVEIMILAVLAVIAALVTIVTELQVIFLQRKPVAYAVSVAPATLAHSHQSLPCLKLQDSTTNLPTNRLNKNLKSNGNALERNPLSSTSALNVSEVKVIFSHNEPSLLPTEPIASFQKSRQLPEQKKSTKAGRKPRTRAVNSSLPVS